MYLNKKELPQGNILNYYNKNEKKTCKFPSHDWSKIISFAAQLAGSSS
jgi:hypothetical protein